MNPTLVSVRDLSADDVPMVLQYWFHSPPGFLDAMGVDPGKMPREDEMEATLRERLVNNSRLATSRLNALAITYDGEAVGFHTINPLVEGDHGIFHAHISNPVLRGRGLGFHSYPKACKIFFERFRLGRILFKTPAQNVGAIRVKEKLGIRCIGQEVIDFSIIRAGTHAMVFELTREEAEGTLG